MNHEQKELRVKTPSLRPSVKVRETRCWCVFGAYLVRAWCVSGAFSSKASCDGFMEIIL